MLGPNTCGYGALSNLILLGLYMRQAQALMGLTPCQTQHPPIQVFFHEQVLEMRI
jgi:hypothetical protein